MIRARTNLAATILAIFLCWTIPPNGNAAELQSSPTLARIAKSGSITVGYRKNAPPISFSGPGGRPVGYAIDLCKEVIAEVRTALGKADLAVNWKPVTPATRMELIATGAIDLECGATTITMERQKRADFSLITFISGTQVMVPRNSIRKDLRSLAVGTIGVVKGSTNERTLRNFVSKTGISVQLMTFPNHETGFAAMVAGEINAYAADHIILHGLVRTSLSAPQFALVKDFLSYEPYGFLLPRGDPDFRLIVNRRLARVFRTKQIKKIYKKWFAKLGAPIPNILLAAYVIQSYPER
jgi:glutamate/aspartate transport system substrate-binding protein